MPAWGPELSRRKSAAILAVVTAARAARGCDAGVGVEVGERVERVRGDGEVAPGALGQMLHGERGVA